LDAWVHLDPHLIWQATESYMERRDAFGLVPHECLYQLMPEIAYNILTPFASAQQSVFS
jgi:hypothetical protein